MSLCDIPVFVEALGESRSTASFMRLLRVHRQELELMFEKKEDALNYELRRQLRLV
jgi:hypothetical protein